MENKRIETDFLVIGSGLAALNFSLRVSDHGRVIILTKKERTEANTNYAQGGIASVFSKEDSFESHKEDTMKAGEGLSEEKMVDIMVKEGPSLVKDLIDWGVSFSRNESSNLELWREGGHSHRRIVHAGDTTGQEIERSLISAIKRHPNIRLFEHHIAYELLVDDGECHGVRVLDVSTGEVMQITADVTLLATGGAGQVYQHTSNPSIATGDGISMAYDSGCSIADLEFFQFHPTTLYTSKFVERQFLISEAVRGEGAKLYDRDNNRFMEGVHPRKELAPRDVVAREIDKVLKKKGDDFVYLDISFMEKEKITKKFPGIYRECLKYSVNITEEPIPVVPAAHYMCGGVKIDENARTDLRGLLAAGEVAFTGVHGANRLASNSLIETLVFSTRAAKISKEWMVKNAPSPDLFREKERKSTLEESILAVHARKEIKQTMCDYVGIVRRDYLLNRAIRRLDLYREEITNLYRNTYLSRDLIELKSIADVSYLITKSAINRKESRGLHFNKDHPEKKVSFKKHTIIKKEE